MIGFSVPLEIPDLEFELAEVELVDPDAIAGLVGTPEAEAPPQPPATPPTTAPDDTDQKAQEEAERKRLEADAKRLEQEKKEAEEKKKARKERRKERKEQRKNFASQGSNADQLAPPTSTFHLLLVPKKIRRLPFAKTAFSLLEPWPDFDFLVRKGGLDPLQDVDHIVIASPNITNALDTFLAVEYRTSRKKIIRAIERAVATDGQVIEWVDDHGFLRGNPRPADKTKPDRDNRWFVFHPKKKVAMFVREVFLDQILADSAAPVGEAGTAREFVDNLTKLREFAEQQPLSGLQLKVADLSNTVSGLKLPFPAPDLIELTIEAAKAPIMVLKFDFTDIVDAKQFLIYYNETLGEHLRGFQYQITGVTRIYEDIAVTRNETMITLRTELSQAQIELVLDSVVKLTKKATDHADRGRADNKKSG